MPNITVKLIAKAAEAAAAHETTVTTLGGTPKEIIAELAKSNPVLGDLIARSDGSPRSSTKILVDGIPPRDFSAPIPANARVAIAVVMPCDG